MCRGVVPRRKTCHKRHRSIATVDVAVWPHVVARICLSQGGMDTPMVV